MANSGMIPSTADNQKEYVLAWDYNYIYWYTYTVKYNGILPSETGKANIFPKLFKTTLFDVITKGETYGNSRCSITMINTDNWSDFKDDKYADYAIGGPTLEMWIASWNMRHPELKVYCSAGEEGYYLDYKEPPDGEPRLICQGQKDKLYFPHENFAEDFDGDGDIESCYGYWLASPSRILWKYAESIL